MDNCRMEVRSIIQEALDRLPPARASTGSVIIFAVSTRQPMRTPKATLTNRCDGMGRAMPFCMRYNNTSGTASRASSVNAQDDVVQ
jgi:hypothetical protein